MRASPDVVEKVVGVFDDGFVDRGGGAIGEDSGREAGIEAEDRFEEIS